MGHTAQKGDMRNAEFWSEYLKGQDHLEDQGIGLRILLQ